VTNAFTHRRGSLATLVWTVPVRIVDVSRCGCQLESARLLDTGTHGQLRLAIGGRIHLDDVRIARCQQREGAGQRYFLGAELLRTRRLHARSIRIAIGRLLEQDEVPDHLAPAAVVLGRSDREPEPLTRGVTRAPPYRAPHES
jgi:hypothetical protein